MRLKIVIPILFLFLTSNLLQSQSIESKQKRVFGKVVDIDNNPLIGAAIYLNNTSIGTTTDDKGEFELRLKSRNVEIIVSYLGYETIKYTLDSENIYKKLIFQLIRKVNVLNEVVIKSRREKMSARARAFYLKRFKNSFLGRSNLASTCKILNEDDIELYYNKKTQTLEVYVSEPIIIKNSGLGYLVNYELIDYKQTPTRISYLGYAKYEDLEGSKRKKRRWEKQRKKAYNGSSMHFVRSLREGVFSNEGFVVDQFKLVPNPKRPSEEEIKKARNYIQSISKNTNNRINLSSRNFLSNPKTKLDSARVVLHNSRLKKLIKVPLKKNLQPQDLISNSPEGIKLAFKHSIKISYLNEREELKFRTGPRRLKYQVSNARLYKDFVFLDNSGEIFPALDITIDGYWGYEGFATKLPLDYYIE